MKTMMLMGLALALVGCGGAPVEIVEQRVDATEAGADDAQDKDAGSAGDAMAVPEAAPDIDAGRSCVGTTCCYLPMVAGCQPAKVGAGPTAEDVWVPACCPAGAPQNECQTAGIRGVDGNGYCIGP